MRHHERLHHLLRVTSRRTSVVLALTLSLFLLPVLSAQQQPQNGAPGEPAQEATVPYGPPPTDNLPPAPNSVVPPVLTIPAGTFVTVRLMGTLSSDINQPGDGFSATLEQPIVVDGWVVARRGQIAIGRVVSAEKAGRVKGVSSMGVALSDLPLVDGRQAPVLSQLVQTSAGTSRDVTPSPWLPPPAWARHRRCSRWRSGRGHRRCGGCGRGNRGGVADSGQADRHAFRNPAHVPPAGADRSEY